MRSPLHSCVRARARGSLSRVSVSCVPAGKCRAVTCGAMAAAALPRRSPREVTSSGHWRKRAAAGHNETLEGRLEEVRLLADVEDVHGGRQLLWRLQVEAPHLGLEESDADVARVDAHAGCGSTEADDLQRLAADAEHLQPLAVRLCHIQPSVADRDAHRRRECARRVALREAVRPVAVRLADHALEAAVLVEDPDAVRASVGHVEPPCVVRDPLRVDEAVLALRPKAAVPKGEAEGQVREREAADARVASVDHVDGLAARGEAPRVAELAVGAAPLPRRRDEAAARGARLDHPV
mmetsp:Transcript_8445/g.26977  ORF Transcript_8445/g.26977 Transcript_8445/m.26977 type:complete len:295 (-) Transcript_8445:514-1398(-)